MTKEKLLDKHIYIENDGLREALEDFEVEWKELKRYKKLNIEKCTLLQLEDVFFTLQSLLKNENLAYLLRESKKVLKETNKINDMV